jgi:formamidopyrimidine-DNA glycosylase
MTGQLVFVSSTHYPKSLPIERGLTSTIIGGHPIQESETKLPHKHTYIIFQLDTGTLYYNDIRQFGYVLYFENENLLNSEKHFEGIGIEPFDKEFTLPYFQTEINIFKKRKIKTPIKKILLDQKIVVGCGNIYCDEILWASGILPQRPICQITESEASKIYSNIIKILDKAIHSGGSSVANYLLADGKRGNYTDYHKVYQKDGTPCQKKGCPGTIQKSILAGRGTHFCPIHQK